MPFKNEIPTHPKRKVSSTTIPTQIGPGAVMLSRAEMTLAEVQCHLDKEGASNLVVEIIMMNPNYAIFVESVELGIALLEGGNTAIQKSMLIKLASGNNSEKFFRVFYEKIKSAQQEIKSTISVNSSELITRRENESVVSDSKEVSHIKRLSKSTPRPSNGVVMTDDLKKHLDDGK